MRRFLHAPAWDLTRLPGTGKCSCWWLAAFVLVVNIILIVTEQGGLLDVLTGLPDLVLLGPVVSIRPLSV